MILKIKINKFTMSIYNQISACVIYSQFFFFCYIVLRLLFFLQLIFILLSSNFIMKIFNSYPVSLLFDIICNVEYNAFISDIEQTVFFFLFKHCIQFISCDTNTHTIKRHFGIEDIGIDIVKIIFLNNINHKGKKTTNINLINQACDHIRRHSVLKSPHHLF